MHAWNNTLYLDSVNLRANCSARDVIIAPVRGRAGSVVSAFPVQHTWEVFMTILDWKVISMVNLTSFDFYFDFYIVGKAPSFPELSCICQGTL